MYPVLEFTCAFTAAFHTSEHNYANLYTCAPYILGTTLRGAVLRALIDSDCTGTQLHPTPTFHNDCDATCQVRPLFFPPTRFSFGTLLAERPSAVRTRVGIDRASQGAAQGVLLSTEVRHGQFAFGVMLPDRSLEDIVRAAVVWAGIRPDSGGLGRFRSVGWGAFEVLAVTATTAPLPPAGGQRYRFTFRTPYVLEEHFLDPAQRPAALTTQLRTALSADLGATVQVTAVELEIQSLAYVRRWSDEHQRKENRSVAGPGTALGVTFAEPVLETQLQLWQWGIGEWYEAGFGSCAITAMELEA